jgi:tetratricopeptide (TPR) repeat protein
VVIRFQSRLVKVLLKVLAIALAASLSALVALRATTIWFATQPSAAMSAKALKLESHDCTALFRNGLIQAFGPEGDPNLAVDYLARAVKCQPLSSMYRISYAMALEGAGKSTEAVMEANQATALGPYYVPYLWIGGNVLLRAGETGQAMHMFKRVLAGDDGYADQVFHVAWKAGGNPQQIIQQVVPDDPKNYIHLVNFLSSQEIQDYPDAQRAWTKLMSFNGQIEASDCFPYLEALLNVGQTDWATQDWNQLVAFGALPPEEVRRKDNMIVNGSFEVQPSGGGLDWRILETHGVLVQLDRQIFFDGAQSLSIQFEGLENLDYHGVLQIVPVQANTDYTLEAYVKSRALSTLEGPFVEVYDPDSAKELRWRSKVMLGTMEWSHLTLPFKTGPNTNRVIVVIRRKPAVELDKRIQGTLWIDNFHMLPTDQIR